MHTTPAWVDAFEQAGSRLADLAARGGLTRGLRAVPRHLFLPDVDLEVAYGRNPVVTRRAADGTSTSSASSPKLVATMLEQLAAEPGQRVLEIGAATGINAALIAELVGPTGRVVTIELDDDLAAGAAKSLATAGYPDVKVICGGTTVWRPGVSPRRSGRSWGRCCWTGVRAGG